MNTYLDHYCERINTEIWNEPFNIFTNVAFLFVGYLLYQKAKSSSSKNQKPHPDIWILISCIFIIGIGSAIWHILAQYWALWFDRTPILAFISLFIISCLVRIFELSLLKAIIFFLLFQVINTLVLTALPPDTLNGSLFYLPTGVLLFTITLILWLQNQPIVKYYFLAGSITFVIAIVFRTIDLSVCNSFSIGTHFVWHILIAITIFMLMSGLIDSIKQNEKAPASYDY